MTLMIRATAAFLLASEITRAANKYIDDHPEIITLATESYRSLVASGQLRPPRNQSCAALVTFAQKRKP